MILKTLVCFGILSLAKSELFKSDVKNHMTNHILHTDERDLMEIEKPCRIYDMFCIREFFAKHSQCKEVLGPAPNPIYKAQSTFYLPRLNLSLTSLKIAYTGINGKVIEFYINKKTDRLVLAVDFTNLSFGSNENYFKFHRRAREPLVGTGIFNVTYTSAVVTIVIPNLKDLQLKDSSVFLYGSDTNPVFVVDPLAFVSTDPQTEESLVLFAADLASDVKEGFLTDSQFYIGSFIQYNICDFGLEIL